MEGEGGPGDGASGSQGAGGGGPGGGRSVLCGLQLPDLVFDHFLISLGFVYVSVFFGFCFCF